MKRSTLIFGACILVATAGALAIRLPSLDLRPMHPDEANQADRTGKLLDHGKYEYEPVAHHGPTLYYLTLPSLWANGARDYADSTVFDYRIVPVVFSAAVVLLVLVIGRGIGWPAAVVAAVLAAISPALVYYGRDYIQESLLVFFTFAAIVSAWRYLAGGSAAWAVAAGLFFGLMYATKETWILAAAAAVGGVVLWVVWTRLLDGRWPMSVSCPRLWPLAAAVLVAALTIVAFYSAFGRNLAGPWDSIVAYGNYFGQATSDKAHLHPWYYYLSLLVYQHPQKGFTWSEGLIVGLAAVGVVAALSGRGLGQASVGLVRFLAFYTVLLTAIYSAIPYKTPWCLISFLQAMTVMAGVGAVALARLARFWPLKIVVAAVLLVPAVLLANETYWLNFLLPADSRNPYVYAQTSTDTLNLVRLVDRLAAASPKGRDINIQVIHENYWPLPWYFRRYPNVGYRQEVREVPHEFSADIVIVATEQEDALNSVLRGTYNNQALFGLRFGFNVRVYVEEGLWQAMLARSASESGGAKP